MPENGNVSGVTGGLAAALRAPVSRRSWRELLFCLLGLFVGVPLPLALLFLALALVSPALISPSDITPPARLFGLLGVLIVPVLVLLVTGGLRGLGRFWRTLASRLLGLRIPAPPPRAGPRLRSVLRDGPSWRALGYLLIKVPVGIVEGYAAFFWIGGLVNLSYPIWWQSFRNHPPGTRLGSVPVFTPLGYYGQGTFRVDSLAQTGEAVAVGLAMLLVAPWVTRAMARADGFLMERMLGPGRLQQRVADLEGARALVVNDAAANLRRLERDLHDGAQIRLATLAMNLGLARKKLGDEGEPLDLEATRELLGSAHQGAKDALAELRALALGIHPPVLDNGLPDALATLTASSPVPVRLGVALLGRPSPAIETMAYFCAAELLANAAKHSAANAIAVEVSDAGGTLTLTVRDDGRGGADPAGGSGLAGLTQRVRTVDGQLDLVSPVGGPTEVTVTLPLRA
jgi:signal transduction histidine kinase